MIVAKVISPLGAAEARGSVAGVTYSRNTMGLYARAKASPVQPRTNAQQEARWIFQRLVREFQDLTTAQITLWVDFAANWTRKDAFGNDIHVTALNWYQTFNARRLRWFPSLPTPPLNPNTNYVPVITVQQEVVIAGDITITYAPAPVVAEVIWCYWGGNNPRSARFAKKDIRFRAHVTWADASPKVLIPYAELSPDDSVRQVKIVPVDTFGRAGVAQTFLVYPVTFP